MLLALDDTDTRQGGCTTHAAFRIACALDAAGGPLSEWGLAAPARLVRLDPAAPHRTRGNGALVLPLGVGRPRQEAPLGVRPDGAPLLARAGAARAPPHAHALAALRRLVRAVLPAPATPPADPQPGAVLVPGALPAWLYEAAVARPVTHEAAWAAAPPGTIRLGDGPRRGEIGALAAAAWSPEGQGAWTWEAVGYRPPGEAGPVRALPAGFATRVEALPGAFDNRDASTGRLRCVPRTPCPVLFGVRGLDPHALLGHLVGAGAGGGWVVQTNHASGDHARYARDGPEPFAVVRFDVEIAGVPLRARGGHVFVEAAWARGAVRLAAFEPTKGLRGALMGVVPGDRLHVVGRCGPDAGVLALEAFEVRGVAERRRAAGNPRCTPCGTAMKSTGTGGGFRCRRCGTRAPADAKAWTPVPPPFAPGAWFQVPDAVRGHLLPPAGGLPPAAGWLGPASRPLAPVFGAARAFVVA